MSDASRIRDELAELRNDRKELVRHLGSALLEVEDYKGLLAIGVVSFPVRALSRHLRRTRLLADGMVTRIERIEATLGEATPPPVEPATEAARPRLRLVK